MAQIPLETIISAVALRTGVSRAELCDRDERSRYVSRSRQLVWLLIERLRLDVSMTTIGRRVGGRDVTSVHRGISRAEARLAAHEPLLVADLAAVLRDLDVTELPSGGEALARRRARADLQHRLRATEQRRRDLATQLAALDGASA